jgi:O-antigen biosynthesis protein
MTTPGAAVAGTRPLVITGMHRSGTSLVASLFAGAGVNVGTRLIGASRGNDRGHWEDLDFYEFHARVLEANGVGSEGFSCAADLIVPPPLRDEAVAVVAAKAAAATPWGWKDPRTTLFLEFWQSLLPEAVFVFVFRSPWEVADSLFRRGDELFVRHPAFAVRVWHHYNRRILDFCTAHAPRCLVTEVTQMVADPAAVFAEVRERLGVPVGEPPQRFEEPLLRRDDGRQRRAIVAAFQPEAVELYAELRRRAGVEASSPEEPLASDAATMAERAIGEWSRAAAAAHQSSMAAEARVAAEVAARIADLERAKRAAEGRSWELQGRIDELALQVQRLTLGGAAADGRHAA